MKNNLTARIESYLFYAGDAKSFKNIAKACEVSEDTVEATLEKLSEELEDRGVCLIIHDNSAQLVIDREYSDMISRVRDKEVDSDLTDAQAEALSVVAYLAPVQKMTVDFIRGVNSRAVLRNLLTRGLVSAYSKDSVRYHTITSDALAHLGITRLKDMPAYEETRAKLQEFINSDTVMAELEKGEL